MEKTTEEDSNQIFGRMYALLIDLQRGMKVLEELLGVLDAGNRAENAVGSSYVNPFRFIYILLKRNKIYHTRQSCLRLCFSYVLKEGRRVKCGA